MHSAGVDGDINSQLLSLPKRDIIVESDFFGERGVGWVRTFCQGPNRCILRPTLTGKAFPQNLNGAS